METSSKDEMEKSALNFIEQSYNRLSLSGNFKLATIVQDLPIIPHVATDSFGSQLLLPYLKQEKQTEVTRCDTPITKESEVKLIGQLDKRRAETLDFRICVQTYDDLMKIENKERGSDWES
ncbi:hypothetical protein [Listeria newyorkensis]|uniref:hypothetical protein n=1 Tax=Listeria newyorkensis TaxID=1497681 RepID=UPI00051CDBB6|nr:hypothetical protein [Listeria newyorkensis]KGL43635.1 hypothetical protein EP58_07820 [Listeria newyorkensis]